MRHIASALVQKTSFIIVKIWDQIRNLPFWKNFMHPA
jgi:hypothetical protein